MTTPRPGDRIKLIAMPDDPDPIAFGSKGTVTFVNSHGGGPRILFQIGVDWDNGRRLMLSVPPDECEVISRWPPRLSGTFRLYETWIRDLASAWGWADRLRFGY
jgi:hypothetical protein